MSPERPPYHADDGPDSGPRRLPDGRREPGLGDLDGMRFQSRQRASRRRPEEPWLQRHWPWMAAGAVVLLCALLLLRQPLAEWLWPQNRAQEVLREADAALQRGHLSAADGSGARELYEAALAMDPDRNEPQQGLARVALAALDLAQQETADGRFEQAHASLRLARELSAPRDRTQAVADALRDREAADAGLDGLWARAHRAHEAGNLYGAEDAALPLYRRILQFDPDHLDALRGRDDAIGELLQQARDGLRGGEFAAAAEAIAVAREFDRGHPDLPDTEARLAEERDAALARANEDLEAGRLDRAEQRYRALFDMGGDVAEAQAGLVQIGLVHAQRAGRLAGDFRFADADAAMERARALAPDHEQVRTVADRIEASRQRRAQFEPALSPAQRRQRVSALLEDARKAEQRGDLLSPPGDSAYDKLRAASAIAPDDPEVRVAIERLLPAATACFERELRSNSLGRARVCLDARAALGEDERALSGARRRLAQRWLAVGDERLGAGELASARAALQSARDIDPSTPELAGFAERLRAASASAD